MLSFALATLLPFVAFSAPQAGQAPAARPAAADRMVSNTPPIPATPAAVLELVEARPFVLASPERQEWRKADPVVKAGWLVVVRVASDYVRPRQVAQPILMVGATIAEPLNIGYASQMVVAIVPSAVKDDGSLALDLAAEPIYFGQPMLPETVDQATAEGQRDFALRSGIAPLGAAKAAAAVAKAGADAAKPIVLADREALDKVAGGLVRIHAVDESQRADELEGIAAQGEASEPRPVTTPAAPAK
jgi:hypothetical protein